MDFLQLARNRYSCRNYKRVSVEKEKLEQVLEAGRIAPSACNLQPFYFVVVTDEDLKKKVVFTYKRQWIEKAPAIIVTCGDHSKSWKRNDGKDHCDIDVAIAIDHMTLMATELGLATCWVCAFDAAKCREILNLPAHIEPVALLPIGYPADNGNLDRYETQRKSLDDIVCWNGFQGA